MFCVSWAAMDPSAAGAVEDKKKGKGLKVRDYVRDYSLDGLAVSWDNIPEIRARLRSCHNLVMHRCPKLKEVFNVSVKTTIYNVRENAVVLRPVLKFIAVEGAAPAIDRLAEQVQKLLDDTSAKLRGQTLYEQAWAIRHLIALLKKNSSKSSWRQDPGIATNSILHNKPYISP